MSKILSRLTKIVASLAVALTVGLSLVPATSVFAADCDPNNPSISGGANCAKTEDQAGDLFGPQGIITTIINVVLFIVGMLSVVMLIFGGIKYTTSAGDAAKVTAAKNTIMYAIIGLVISILAYAVVNFIISSLAKN